MGLLDFFRPDPCAQWPSYARASLAFDLARGQVEPIRLGGPAESLRRLGRPDNQRPFRENQFRYHDLGLLVDVENGQVEGLEFVVDPATYPTQSMQGCAVEMVCPNGAILDMTGGISWEAVAAELGEPAEVDDEDPDDLVLTYCFGELTVEFECRREDRVAHINVYRDMPKPAGD